MDQFELSTFDCKNKMKLKKKKKLNIEKFEFCRSIFCYAPRCMHIHNAHPSGINNCSCPQALLYTLRILCGCCSQFQLMILKTCKSTLRAVFLYNCAPHSFKHLAQCLQACKHRVGFIHLPHGYQYFVGNI